MTALIPTINLQHAVVQVVYNGFKGAADVLLPQASKILALKTGEQVALRFSGERAVAVRAGVCASSRSACAKKVQQP